MQVRGKKNTASQLASVYSRYAARVYSFSRRLIVDVSLAESATIDVFVQFNRIQARWQDESRTLVCLRELAIESALAHLQERSSSAELIGLPSSTLASSNRTTRLDPVKLERLIARLPDSLRIPYVLRDVEGLSDNDVATRLRLAKADVRHRINTARLELRRLWLG
nr:Sigma-70, region 4 [uncultured bacterium]